MTTSATLKQEGVKEYQFKGRDYVRALVRSRDKYRCQAEGCTTVRFPKDVTGKMKSLDIHHLNGNCGKNSHGYDRVKDMDGLITLCHLHHFQRHDFSIEGKENMRKPKT
jgi:hypothetical protein